jgi:hypothetical protein
MLKLCMFCLLTDHQRMRMDNNLSNTKTSDWPQSTLNKKIENILTKLLILI